MPRGLRLPVGVDAAGKTAMIDGDEEDSKIIRTGIGDADSEHAFQQDLGTGSDIVFSVASTEGQALIRSKVRKLFDQFRTEERFKLVPGSVKLTEGPVEGELTLELKYFNLESDEENPRTFREVFSGAVP